VKKLAILGLICPIIMLHLAIIRHNTLIIKSINLLTRISKMYQAILGISILNKKRNIMCDISHYSIKYHLFRLILAYSTKYPNFSTFSDILRIIQIPPHIPADLNPRQKMACRDGTI
jgi:hypothetical protein